MSTIARLRDEVRKHEAFANTLVPVSRNALAALLDCAEALQNARAHIITLHPAHDPRKIEPRDAQDQVQIAVLDEIDAALSRLEEGQ